MEKENSHISRAEFEKNLLLKQKNPVFISDIKPLLSPKHVKSYQFEEAYNILFRDFLPKLNGDPWKELEKN